MCCRNGAVEIRFVEILVMLQIFSALCEAECKRFFTLKCRVKRQGYIYSYSVMKRFRQNIAPFMIKNSAEEKTNFIE